MSIDARLRKLEVAARRRKQAQPPDPVRASVTERLCSALTLALIDRTDGHADEPDQDEDEGSLRQAFLQNLVKLRLIVPDALSDVVWRRACTLRARTRRDPNCLARLQVPPHMRPTTIELRDARPDKCGGAAAV